MSVDVSESQSSQNLSPLSLQEMTEKFKEHKVVPDVIRRLPHSVLNVEYPGNVLVELGNELTPTKVKDIPHIEFEMEEGTYYVLIMTDPDAPSRSKPKFREWHHWLVANIHGESFDKGIEKGVTLSEYVGAGPPKGTGLHRYVFLLYKQPRKLTFDETRLTNKSGNGRAMFSTKKFASKYGLGDPIAGNFFQAQWDEYVPTLYKQLGE